MQEGQCELNQTNQGIVKTVIHPIRILPIQPSLRPIAITITYGIVYNAKYSDTHGTNGKYWDHMFGIVHNDNYAPILTETLWNLTPIGRSGLYFCWHSKSYFLDTISLHFLPINTRHPVNAIDMSNPILSICVSIS